MMIIYFLLSGLVAKRHYNFGHGIGRSGDLLEAQPKAAGSSILAELTNLLLLDLMKFLGIRTTTKSVIVPMATGMTILLSILSFKAARCGAKYILWSRIDQKSCFKSILATGAIPVIIEPKLVNEQLETDIELFESRILELEPENIICIISTTSCFAPRACDNIVELGKLCDKFNIPHLVNNAYGLQSTYYAHQIEQATRSGRVDLFIQSTDKNLMVPVGGAIIASSNCETINNVAKFYPGRASSSQSLDVFMTVLSLGRLGYKRMMTERSELFEYMKLKLSDLASKYHERVLNSNKNPISLAISLSTFDEDQLTRIGSMLFLRGVSGTRVITSFETKTMKEYKFQCWGSHTSICSTPYLTAAVALGIRKDEIDIFIAKLDKILTKIKLSQAVAENTDNIRVIKEI